MSISKGYKAHATGEIPEEWDTVNLKDVLFELANGITSYQSADETDYPVTRIETISDGVINPEKVKFLERISKQDFVKYRLRNGDILFSHINSVKHIAKTAIYEGNPPLLVHGMNLLLLRPNGEKVYPRFLLNLLKFEKTRNKFRSLAKKAINQASINQKEVGSVKILLPPLTEQHRINSVLSTADEAIQKTDAVIRKVEVLKRGLMQRLLTRGIGHNRFKETELGAIPREWAVIQYSEGCSKITVGIVVKPAKYYVDSGVPCFRSFNILENRIEPSDLVYISHDANKLHSKSIIRTGDVVTVRTGKPGVSAVVPSTYDGANCVDLIISRTNELISPHFLSCFLNSQLAKRQIVSWQGGSMQQHLNVGNIKKLKILLPTKDEQDKIVRILRICDDKLKKERKAKNQFDTLKLGLMLTLLTGKVRVKVN